MNTLSTQNISIIKSLIVSQYVGYYTTLFDIYGLQNSK